MTTLKDRLEELMAENGITSQQQLAEFAGVTKGLVNQWFNGSTGLGKKPLIAFEKKTNFSTQWLVDGTGEKYKSDHLSIDFARRLNSAMEAAGVKLPELSQQTGINYEMVRRYSLGYAKPRSEGMQKIADALNVSPAWLQFGETLMPSAGAIAIQENVDTENTHKEIPLYDYKLSAGTGNFVWVANHQEDPLVFREQWFRAKQLRPEDLRAMYVKGDSMVPDLNNWDTVIIDITDTEPMDGEIYACIFKDKFFIKKIRHTENGISLISSNTEYDPIEVTFEDADRFQILGRKVWRGG